MTSPDPQALPKRRLWHPRRWGETLKARLAAGALAALLAGVAFTAWHQAHVAERELLASVREREHVEAQRTAAVVGKRVLEMQRVVDLTARQLDRATLNDPAALSAFFEQQPVLRSLFSNVFAAKPDGTMLHLHDASGARKPILSIGDREYFRRTVAERRAMVSEPVLGRLSNEPVIMFTQPLVADGEVWGVIGGGLRLASRDLLADLTESHEEERDALVIVTNERGLILAHPHRDRLLERLASEPRMTEAAAAWAADGYPLLGSPSLWQQRGEVIGMAGDTTTGWHIWRATNAAELLRPLHKARTEAMRAAAAVAIGLALLLMLFLAWQLRPLALLERRALALRDGRASPDDGRWPRARGEIGQLARTLEHVWTERARIEAEGAALQQRLLSVMAASPVGIAFTRNQRFELVSGEFCHILGYTQEGLLGEPAQKIFASNEDYLALGPKVGAAFAGQGHYVGEWKLLRADGSLFWCRVHARPVIPGDPAAGTIWCGFDISDEVQSRRKLEHAASHDPLTGLKNREHFQRALELVYAARDDGVPSALLMVDLDHFKPINDSAGHAAGDAMLKAVAAALQAQVRGSDIVARYGGDEFAVLLGGCDQPRALAVAEKVREAIGELALTWSGQTLRVGASVGVAELVPQHGSVAQWLADADAACYAAKRAGRGVVRLAAGGGARGNLTLV